jgi:guanylate kinase
MSSAILILSGPSGAGKSTIINAAADRIGEFYFSISSTSRAPRAGEKDGREYHFVTKEVFEKGIEEGEFLEYAVVHGNYYGTSLKPVKEALEAGKLVIFDIDVQGFHLAKERMGDLITSVFILPPSLSELEKRLTARLTDSPEVISQRLKNAKREILEIGAYDFVIVNDEIETAVEKFVAVANTARLKLSNKAGKNFVNRWLSS